MAPSAEALRQRAAHLTALGRHNEAIPLLTRAASLDPHDPDIKCDLAVALMNAGRLEDADRVAFEAIGSAPEHERSYRVRSIVLGEMGRSNDALTLARESVRLEPDNLSGLRTLAQACLDCRKTSEAWAIAQRVVALAPEESASHHLVGRVAIAMRWWPLAESANQEALRLDPSDWAAMNNLGIALLRQGRRAEAAHAYDRAAQMNPADETPRRNMVQTVRPGHGGQMIVDALVMLVMPLTAPAVLIRWTARWAQARQARSGLSLGARHYYASQSVAGIFGRFSAREFGIACGAASLVLWWLLTPFEIVGLTALLPQWQSFDVLFPFGATFPLAIGTGFLCAWLRSRRSRKLTG